MKLGLMIALVSVPVHLLVYLAPAANWASLWLIPGCMLAAAPFGIVTVAASLVSAVLLWLGLKPFLRSLDRLKELTAVNV
jgi:hypothetical protein